MMKKDAEIKKIIIKNKFKKTIIIIIVKIKIMMN
jgi:hypothetical protein